MRKAFLIVSALVVLIAVLVYTGVIKIKGNPTGLPGNPGNKSTSTK